MSDVMPPQLPLRVQIIRRVAIADEVVALTLAGADGGTLPVFEAGAHIDVQCSPGIVRQYSLCNVPGVSRQYQIAVLRAPQSRGGSQAVHATFALSREISIGIPRNRFPLVPAAKFSLLLAAGIGITPLLAMAHALHRQRSRFILHYCTRSPSKAAFRQFLSKAPFCASVCFHFDDGLPQQHLDLQDALSTCHPGTHVYTCGPAGFIAWVLSTAQATGIPATHIHYERFEAEPDEDHDSEEAFSIRVAGTGKLIDVPAGVSALDALAAAGIEIPSSCEQGICGTCAVRVLAGEPDHRDSYFTDAEHSANTWFTPCCSRARSGTLTLDL